MKVKMEPEKLIKEQTKILQRLIEKKEIRTIKINEIEKNIIFRLEGIDKLAKESENEIKGLFRLI